MACLTTDQIRSPGLMVLDSFANFLVVRFPLAIIRQRSNFDATAADNFLKSKGIIVRWLAGYGLPDALRISIGLEEEMRQVVNAQRRF